MYVGLWSAWWYGEGETGGIKVILVTTPNQSNLQDRMALNQIPWFILQLQTLAPDGDSWAQISDLLQPEIRVYMPVHNIYPAFNSADAKNIPTVSLQTDIRHDSR